MSGEAGRGEAGRGEAGRGEAGRGEAVRGEAVRGGAGPVGAGPVGRAGRGEAGRAGTGPVGVVSPHMDDAALSCGQMLSAIPGSHVVTVFSSGPKSVRPLPEWDKLSGSFKPGDDVMGLRHVEDDDAMAVVGAHGHRLDFWDEQYRAGRPVRLARFRPGAVAAARAKLADPDLEAAVVEELRTVVADLDLETWFVPLGLWHGDHKVTARACLRLAREMPERRWVVYEELPYRWEVPTEVTAAKQRVENNGFTLEAAQFPSGPDNAKKHAMVRCYRSQLPCLGDRADVAAGGPEAFHILSHILRSEP